MADLQQDNRRNNGSNLGRARQRRQKRGNASENPTPANHANESRRSAKTRVTRRNGASMRERRVIDQIKGSDEVFPAIEEKLNAVLGLGNTPGKRSARGRRRESGLRGENQYEATMRKEPQRISNAEQEYQARKERRIYDSRSEGAPPVMVRGGMGGMAFGRAASARLQKQRTPRRRIDVPLRAAGAEVRLPSIPLVNLGWRSVSLVMVILMSACLLLMWQAPVFKVGNVAAQGNKRVTVSDLNTVLGTYGRSVFSLNPVTLREALQQAFPEFSKVSVHIGLPASVRVVVSERQPVIVWKQGEVENWVDKDGISFPVRGYADTPLVAVEGYGTEPGTISATTSVGQPAPMPGTPNNPSLRLSADLVSAILALGAKMPVDTVLVYDSQRGLGWNDPNGWEVFFGNEDQDMEMKLIVYQSLVEKLKSEGIQPALISVEYVHAPYYRMER